MTDASMPALRGNPDVMRNWRATLAMACLPRDAEGARNIMALDLLRGQCCRSRLEGDAPRAFDTLAGGIDLQPIVRRAMPSRRPLDSP